MNRPKVRMRASFGLSLAFVLVYGVVLSASHAQAPMKMQRLMGQLDLTTENGPAPLVLNGIASQLGAYDARGEIHYAVGATPDSLVGTGVIVFLGANGDRLVGKVTIDIGPSVDGSPAVRMQFAWRDAVTFSNGVVVANTGRFVANRPAGLVVVGEASDVPLLVKIIVIILRPR